MGRDLDLRRDDDSRNCRRIFLGSIALIADGLHVSTHAGALLLAALAYTYARKHATNEAFAFGSGKFGDLQIVAQHLTLNGTFHSRRLGNRADRPRRTRDAVF